MLQSYNGSEHKAGASHFVFRPEPRPGPERGEEREGRGQNRHQVKPVKLEDWIGKIL